MELSRGFGRLMGDILKKRRGIFTMKKRLLIAGLILLALVLAACGGSGKATPSAASAPGAPPMEPALDRGMAGGDFDDGEISVGEAESFAMEEPAAAEPLPEGYSGANETTVDVAQAAAGQQQRLIIRTGNIALVVEDTRATQEAIERMVDEMAGEDAFVVSSNEYSSGKEGSPYIDMHIRVPATRFDEVMDRLADMAIDVTSRNESGQDVTEEYNDLGLRLESLEAARQRLLEIMENAQTTEDLLQAEYQLTQREVEIESLKGRRQYLSESARLSSISISLQPYILSQPVDSTWRPAETFRIALRDFVRSLQNFGTFAIRFSILVLPWLLVVGLVVYGIVRLVRWRVGIRRERKAAAVPPEDEES
jgi:hypothetical protein